MTSALIHQSASTAQIVNATSKIHRTKFPKPYEATTRFHLAHRSAQRVKIRVEKAETLASPMSVRIRLALDGDKQNVTTSAFPISTSS